MFHYLTDNCDIELTTEQLQFIPKIVLLQYFGRYVELLWDKLPERIKTDSEVQQYRRCPEHYNRPSSRDHIDGPAPMIKDCYVCHPEL